MAANDRRNRETRGTGPAGEGQGTRETQDVHEAHPMQETPGGSEAKDAPGAKIPAGPEARSVVRGETGAETETGRNPHAEHSRSPSPSSSPSFHSPLLPRDQSDTLERRLRHAVEGFVDGPRAAVEEADHVLEEVAASFTDAMTRRRRTLRGAWQPTGGGDDKPPMTADTEQLRLALRDYRELAERLLHV